MEKTPLETWILSRIRSSRSCPALTPTEITSYQFEKVKETVAFARDNSPFYRRLLKDFPGSCISRWEDFSKFPFTYPRDLEEKGEEFLCVSQSSIERVITLSVTGKTARPRRVFFTEKDLELTIDFFHYGMSGLVKPGQRVLILMPGDRPGSIGDLLARALNRMSVMGIVHGIVVDPATTVREIVRKEIDCLVGIPTQVLALARHEDSRFIPKKALKSVLLSSDYVPGIIVKELEDIWGCKVFNHYGTTETGLGGGVECEALSGYHLREADLYFEIVDPSTGQPQPLGNFGEIVFTTLTRKGTPLIRYRTGDLSRMMTGQCPCGTVLKRMDKIHGRLGESVEIGASLWLSITQLDEAIFNIPRVTDYKAIINTESDVDRLHFFVRTASDDAYSTLEAVYNTVRQIPVIREAMSKGSLGLAPVLLRAENWSAGTAVKRRIDDRRPLAGAQRFRLDVPT
jgi:phenylacetate-CoA ligase